MKKILSNKRGDIPITILVIGVIAVCILTIFSFFNSSGHSQETFVGPGLIETMYSFQEENNFGGIEGVNGFEQGFYSELISQGFVSVHFEDRNLIGNYSSYDGKKSFVEIEYNPLG